MTILVPPIGRSVTTRTNACVNPSFEWDKSGQAPGNGWSAFTNCALVVDGSISAPHARLSDNEHVQCLKVTNSNTAAADTGPVWGAGTTGAACSPGDVWTASCYWQAATTARSTLVHLAWYSSAGALLSDVAGASATDSTGGWTRVSVTATAPANAAYVGVIPYVLAAGASEAHYLEDVLLEKAGTLGGYFDGNSDPQSYWTNGETGPAVLQLLSPAPTPLPNWPALDFRVWMDDGTVTILKAPTQGATILQDRMAGFTLSRGRQYELDQDETGDVTVTIDNSDGKLTYGQPGVKPMKYSTLRVWWQGAKYDLFNGYVDAWPTKNDDPARATSTLHLTDVFGVLAQRQMRTMADEAVLSASVPPTLYYPLNEAKGSTAAANLAPGAGSAYPPVPLVNYKGGATDQTPGFGATSFSVNDPDTMFSYQNASGLTNRGTQLQITGPQNPQGPTLDFTKPWFVSATAQCTAGKGFIWSALDPTGQTVLAYLGYDATSSPGVLNIYCAYAGGSGGALTASVSDVHGVPVGMGFDGTNFVIYAYGNLQATKTYSAPAGASSNWIAMGYGFNSTSIQGSSNANLTFGRVGMWLGSCPTSQDAKNFGYACYYGHAQESTTYRINRLLGYCGQPPLYGGGAQSILGAQEDPTNSSALDAIRQAAADELGRVVTGPSGQVEYFNRNHNTYPRTPAYTFGGNTGAGELPYTGSPGFSLDPQYIFNDVQVTQPSNSVGRWIDLTSQGEYFQRVLQTNTNFLHDSDALYAAQWLVSRYKEPVQRIEEITLDPGANPALWSCVLNLDLGMLVQVNHRSVGAPTVSLLCEVQHIKHEVSAGGEDQPPSWRTTLQLTPLLAKYWTLAAMHTTIAATVAAGVTQVTLNPLPDKGYNAAEASLGQGTTIQLSPGTANSETMTIKQVVSQPTAGATGYTSILVTFTAATANPHTAGDYACDPLPSSANGDPTFGDSYSILETNTLTTF